DVGKRRLVARSGFRYAVASFAGADWDWRGANGMRVRAFYVIPMRILPATRAEMLDNDQELDRGARDASMLGAYYLSAPLPDRTQVELTALDLRAPDGTGEAPGPLDLQTYAVRVFRPVARSGWNYEIEGGTQRGVSASTAGIALDHEAYYAHAEIGYSFDVPWVPNLLLQYDRASGDADPTDTRTERFNPLFGERRFDFNPTSIYGIFARSNIESVGIRLESAWTRRWRNMVSYRDFRLASARDAWVGSGWRDPSGTAGRSLGQQIEASFTFVAIPDRLSVETGFALVDSGRFPQQTAGTAFLGSPRYFYAAVTTNF
ncbi:MAG TPA: alginate export family protein, partial [Gammaproteobacteria bacterium]